MSMGTIKIVNQRRGMFAVSVDGADYVVFELTCGSDIEVGDRVIGELESGSCESIHSLNTREPIDVISQATGCSLQSARRLIAL